MLKYWKMEQYSIQSILGSRARSIVKLAKNKRTGDFTYLSLFIGKYIVLKQYLIPLLNLSREEKERLISEVLKLLLFQLDSNSIFFTSQINYCVYWLFWRRWIWVCCDGVCKWWFFTRCMYIRRLLIEYIDCLKKYQYQIPLSLVYSWLETITDVLVYLHSKYCNPVSLYNQ